MDGLQLCFVSQHAESPLRGRVLLRRIDGPGEGVKLRRRRRREDHREHPDRCQEGDDAESPLLLRRPLHQRADALPEVLRRLSARVPQDTRALS